ncbi:MAG: LysR family transcriptional regulator [Fusobacteriaceae bacterium]|nr:LysR family transcriptional regulator [Fusobacteriaceae bacterium]
MDVRYLNYILTIARKKNLTRAAEELYVSQSSLSQFLAKLEDEIGAKLFFRAKGELTLTPAGLLYIQAAEQVVEIRRKLYQNITNLHNRSHITVGVTSQFGLQMLSEIIPPFKGDFPEVTIEISETDVPNLTKMILEENIDLGIMALVDPSPFANQADILRKEEVYFAIPKSHPYYVQNQTMTITARDLVTTFRNDNFFNGRKGSTLRTLADKLFAEFQITPGTMSESNSILMTRSMVAKGIGVMFIGETVIGNTDEIAYYHVSPKLYRLNALVRRRNWSLNKAELAFYEKIKNYFQERNQNQ